MFDVMEADTSVLNDVQKTLASQFLDDMIAPALFRVLKSAKNISTQEILMQIILLSRLGGDKSESDALFAVLAKNNPTWLRPLLENFCGLYQEGNEKHIFMECLLDKRFYIDSKEKDFNSWKERCIKGLIYIYTSKLDKALSKEYPDLFQKLFTEMTVDKSDCSSLDTAPLPYNP